MTNTLQRENRNTAIATELRWIGWVLLFFYSVAAFLIFFGELRTESPFYPEPLRFHYGTTGIAGFMVGWFGFLVADLRRGFSWPWLAGAIACAILTLAGYFVIDAMTVLPG
jgi:hypothetical protein